MVLAFLSKIIYISPSLLTSSVRHSFPRFFGISSQFIGNGDAMLQELEHQVLALYRVLDTAVIDFALRTGLSCPEGCGYCCSSEKVEATVLECIPLAFELFRTFQAELLLKRLIKNSDEKRCVLYRSDFTEAGLGGCTQYTYRAVVCRLFGFAGNPDRQGIPRLAMCRVMKETYCADAAVPQVDGLESSMPLFVDAGVRITSLHPALGTVRMPINTALREALLKVGILLDLTASKMAGATSEDELPPNKPIFPCSPLSRRAA